MAGTSLLIFDPTIKLLLIFTGKIFVPSTTPPDAERHQKITSWCDQTWHWPKDLFQNEPMYCTDVPAWSEDLLALHQTHVHSVNLIWSGTALQQNKAINTMLSWTVEQLYLQPYWFESEHVFFFNKQNINIHAKFGRCSEFIGLCCDIYLFVHIVNVVNILFYFQVGCIANVINK